MSGALVVDAVVADGNVLIPAGQHYEERKRRKAKSWGDGCALKIRIEPADEAAKYHQFKHLFGHLIGPTAKRTGDTKSDLETRLKGYFLPDDGRVSLTELNYEEMKDFIESVEQYIREEYSDAWDDCLAAMALYERRSA